MDNFKMILIEEAKKLQLELKHPYIGTEHALYVLLLNNKRIERILEIDAESFKQAMIDKIGIGTNCSDETKLSPLLERVLARSNDAISFLRGLCQVGEGVAIRILMMIKEDFNVYDIVDEIDEIDVDVDVNAQNVALNEFPYLVNLNSINYKCNPAIEREEILGEIQQVLIKMNKPNVILVGEPGVGKTAIAEGLAYSIQNDTCPEFLKGHTIYSCSTSALVGETKYRGEFEAKINNLCSFLKGKKCVLFLDEIHTTVRAGGAEGAIDMSNILKPYLARGDIRVIGATTIDEYKKTMTNGAYNRRFSVIQVTETSMTATLRILEQSVCKFAEHYKIDIPEKLLSTILSESRPLKGFMPDKTIDLLEAICADAVFYGEPTFSKKDIERVAEAILDGQKQLAIII